jgi:hypothetical protein
VAAVDRIAMMAMVPVMEHVHDGTGKEQQKRHHFPPLGAQSKYRPRSSLRGSF